MRQKRPLQVVDTHCEGKVETLDATERGKPVCHNTVGDLLRRKAEPGQGNDKAELAVAKNFFVTVGKGGRLSCRSTGPTPITRDSRRLSGTLRAPRRHA